MVSPPLLSLILEEPHHYTLKRHSFPWKVFTLDLYFTYPFIQQVYVEFLFCAMVLGYILGLEQGTYLTEFSIQWKHSPPGYKKTVVLTVVYVQE